MDNKEELLNYIGLFFKEEFVPTVTDEASVVQTLEDKAFALKSEGLLPYIAATSLVGAGATMLALYSRKKHQKEVQCESEKLKRKICCAILEVRGNIENKKYKDEEELLQRLRGFRETWGTAYFSPLIAELEFKKGQGEDAIQMLEEDIDALKGNEGATILTYYKYQLHERSGESYEKPEQSDNRWRHIVEARRACWYVTKHATYKTMNHEEKCLLDKARDDFQRIEQEFVQHFLEVPHEKRKLMVPVESYPDLNQKKLVLLDINNLPELQFPVGRPIANQLYVGHPYTPAMYIPFENYELVLLEDKLREYCQVMQFLGATEINIECLNSTDSGKDMHRNKRISGGGSINASVKTSTGNLTEYGGGVSGSFNSEKDTTNKLLEAISHSLQLHQKYSPHCEPKLPEKLVWYAHEPSWQRTFEQRMQGSLLEHEERIETKKNRVVNNSELSDISAELSILVNAKTLAGGGSGGFEAKGRKEELKEVKLDESENAVLFIHVKFAPLESLQGNAPANAPAQITQQSSLTEAETEYLEEVRSCLEEDGEITARARRLLNRIREKSGITEERAAELEATLQTPQLTDEEKEYLDEYKACLEESEDGTLSPRERHLLNKIRASLDITEERATELEKL